MPKPQSPCYPHPRSLSVVIPLYQERDNIEPLLGSIHQGLQGYPHPWELILIDDGSRDGTGQTLFEQAARYGSHVRVIGFRRNFGQTAAMQAGFDAARGALVATLDGDLQNDPAEIPRLIEELLARDLDLLQGWRRDRQDALLLRKIPSRIANGLIARVTGVRLHDYGCSLKVYRAEVIKEIRLFGEMHRFIPVWVAGVTAPERIGETEVGHRARELGQSKYGISRTFRVLLDLLVAFFFLRFGARPGHFFGGIGLSFGLLGTLMMTWLAWVKFGLGEDIGDRPLFFVAILFLVASIQFLTTGVLAEIMTRTLFASGERTHHCICRQTDPATAGWQDGQRDERDLAGVGAEDASLVRAGSREGGRARSDTQEQEQEQDKRQAGLGTRDAGQTPSARLDASPEQAARRSSSVERT